MLLRPCFLARAVCHALKATDAVLRVANSRSGDVRMEGRVTLAAPKDGSTKYNYSAVRQPLPHALIYSTSHLTSLS